MRIAMIGQKGIAMGERGGGIEMHVGELATRLSARGHAVTVYARKRYGGESGEGVQIRFVPTVYRKNLETIVHTFFATVDALFRPYDIIHYHGVGPATLSWIPRLLKPRCRVVATFHSQDRFHQKWSWIARTYLLFGEWATCHVPHATIAVSHVLQVYARDVFHRQIVYIPNGATVQHVTATDQLAAFGLSSKKYVLNVSRLVPHKGQRYLIEAWMRRQGAGGRGQEGMKLVFVGAATYTTAYESKLKDLAAGNPDILFLGYQSGEILRQLFAHAYLYVQPSESEGLPVSVLEAMSFGTPVLVSDIPENLEAMHRAGFAFRNKSAIDLADKLGELLRHPDVVGAAGSEAQDVVRTHFNWDVIADETQEVYRSVRH